MTKIRYRSGRPFIKKYGRDGAWRMSTPSWWVNQQMTRPQRAATRALLGAIGKTPLDELIDHPELPLAKKPHLYYW